MSRLLKSFFSLFALLSSAVLAASTVTHTNSGFIVEQGERVLVVEAISAEIIRVRLTDKKTLNDDRSFAVDLSFRLAGNITVQDDNGLSLLKTDALTVKVQHQSLNVEILDAKGQSLDRDLSDRGFQSFSDGWQLSKRLRDDEQVFGFGEKTGHLNKRGVGLGGYHYAMWNSDTYAYDSSTDPIYVSVPFYLVLRNGNAHGLFLDNSFRTSFDIGKSQAGAMTWSASGGELNYYFIAGPDPKSVIARYSDLTGKMPLPPRWTLGYHQSRWSYFPESRVRLLANTFREKKIPADTLWLDIDYLKGFKPFDWNRDYFPDPAKMIADLKQQGFQLVTIVDAHPKKEIGYAPYDQGIAGEHFVKNPDGSLFEGPVWPSNDPVKPGNSVFPDFTRAKTRAWWGDLHRELVQQGVAGIWNDMNEPAVWIPPSNTMPLNVQHQNDGHPTTQAEIHNVYGLLHTRATFEGLLRLRPDARPFVLTRASFAGGQKYAAVWPGDNTADWSSLRQSLPTLMNMGVSGFSFVGADIGGFAGTPSGELFARWLQAAVFSPFMRAHTDNSTPDQEPWSYGASFEAINRKTIELRYQLLPTLYSVMEEASRTGVPAMRPLFLESPRDWQTWNRDDQYLLGADILVAPVLTESATKRSLYLPSGRWFDFYNGRAIDGGRDITVAVDLASLPIFIREGAFIVRQPIVQNTGEMPTQAMRLDVYPQSKAQREFYVDGGDGFSYRAGDYARFSFSQQRTDKLIKLDIKRVAGTFRMQAPYLELNLVGVAKALSVRCNGVILPALDIQAWHQLQAGWAVVDGVVRVRTNSVNQDNAFTIRL